MSTITVNDNATTLVDELNQLRGGNAKTRNLRVCSYNIGHFRMGHDQSSKISDQVTDYGNEYYAQDSTNYPYPNSNYAVQLKRWKNRLAEIGADVFCACEYNTVFGTLSGATKYAKDVVFDDYPYNFIHDTNTSYWVQAVFSNPKILSTSTHQLLTNERYTALDVIYKAWASEAVVNIGVEVHIACTQLNWSRYPNYKTARTEELAALANLYKNYDYCILCGDFNVDSADEFQVFIDNGFVCANSPLMPLLTCPAQGLKPSVNNGFPTSSLDNIIVKGFSLSDIMVVNDPFLTDHCGVVADLTLINS